MFTVMPEQYTIFPDEDSRTYDFLKARNLAKHTTILESIGHLVKGCVGAGMLGLHNAFMKAGLWTAIIVNIAFGAYLTYCSYILISTAQRLYYRLHIPAMSYSDLAEMSVRTSSFKKLNKYGFTFRVIVDATICFDHFGACCCYQIFMGQTIKQLVENVQETPLEGVGNSPHLRVYMAINAIPLSLICLIRNLKYLAPFTIAADAMILVSVGATIYYSLQIAPPLSTLPAWKSWGGLAEFMGVSVFSMEGVGFCLAIENHMAEPLRFGIMLFGGMTIVVSVVTVTGFFGYWGYGENCLSSVTLNFPMGEILPVAVKTTMALMILVTFALSFWVPFNNIWHYLGKRYPQDKHWFWERVYRFIHVIIITALAAAFPNMGNFMGFIGSLCFSNIGFVFPSLIELLVIWQKPGLGTGKWRLWRNLVIIILGQIFMVFGSLVNGRALFFP